MDFQNGKKKQQNIEQYDVEILADILVKLLDLMCEIQGFQKNMSDTAEAIR